MATGLRGDSHPGPVPFDPSFDPAENEDARLAILAEYQAESLLDDGLASADSLGIGIDADGCGAATASEHLWLMGPLSKARQWEIVAVPDIRGQAERTAERITCVHNPTQ